MALVLLLLPTLAASVLLAAPGQPTVEIFMPPVLDRTLNQTLAPAREIVLAAYADIGVQVLWRSGNPQRSGCRRSSGCRLIIFAFEAGRNHGSADALAFAKPYQKNGPHVVLLLDRLQAEAQRNPSATGILLGHVLAHEIGHVLQGIDRHSEAGLMKARWTVADRLQMHSSRLRFLEYDKILIHDAFQNRTASRQ